MKTPKKISLAKNLLVNTMEQVQSTEENPTNINSTWANTTNENNYTYAMSNMACAAPSTPHPATPMTPCVASVPVASSNRCAERYPTPYPMATTSTQDVTAQTSPYMGAQPIQSAPMVMPPPYNFHQVNNTPMNMMMPPTVSPFSPVNYTAINGEIHKTINQEYIMYLTNELIGIQKLYINRMENVTERLNMLENLLRVNENNVKVGGKRQRDPMTLNMQQNKYQRRN